MTPSILTILAALSGLLVWFLKRKKAPTKEEKKQDIHDEFNDTLETVRRLRSQGKQAQAEELLSRLRVRADPKRLRK